MHSPSCGRTAASQWGVGFAEYSARSRSSTPKIVRKTGKAHPSIARPPMLAAHLREHGRRRSGRAFNRPQPRQNPSLGDRLKKGSLKKRSTAGGAERQARFKMADDSRQKSLSRRRREAEWPSRRRRRFRRPLPRLNLRESNRTRRRSRGDLRSGQKGAAIGWEPFLIMEN
jgi:hypothetical protein